MKVRDVLWIGLFAGLVAGLYFLPRWVKSEEEWNPLDDLPPKEDTLDESSVEVAGKVVYVDHKAELVKILPYGGAEEVTIRMDETKDFSWSPDQQQEETAQFENIKLGSWVRVKHVNNIARSVVIHYSSQKSNV